MMRAAPHPVAPTPGARPAGPAPGSLAVDHSRPGAREPAPSVAAGAPRGRTPQPAQVARDRAARSRRSRPRRLPTACSGPPPARLRARADDAAAGRLPGGSRTPGAPHHETARVQFRPQRQWGGVFTVIVLLLAAAGVGVHLWVIPLDVLITWGSRPVFRSGPIHRAPACASTVSRCRAARRRPCRLARSQRARHRGEPPRLRNDAPLGPLRQVRVAVLHAPDETGSERGSCGGAEELTRGP